MSDIILWMSNVNDDKIHDEFAIILSTVRSLIIYANTARKCTTNINVHFVSFKTRTHNVVIEEYQRLSLDRFERTSVNYITH